MKRFFMSDIYNVDRMTEDFLTVSEAESKYFDRFGYEPDIIKIIDSLGGTVEVIKDLRK